MFDFSFGELSLIGVVALLVLGPERLPRVARTAGALARRARNGWQSVRDEIERELQAEDLKRSLDEAKKTATGLGEDLRQQADEIRSSVDDAAKSVETSAAASTLPPAAAANPAPAPDAPPHERH